MVLKKKQYIPLHVHTSKGSIGDSILKIKDYIKRGKEYGLESLAVTNHGSMADMYDFYNQCTKAGIKPILGCEVYECDDRLLKDKANAGYSHLVLIAKNEIGLRNLLYITTDAQLTGFYYHPRTDLSVLREHGEGIIALSACLGGSIPRMVTLLSGDDVTDEEATEGINNIKQKIMDYVSVFDEFYLEMQPGDFQEQIFLNQALVYLSQETGVPLVITNDVHYLDPEDYYAHDVHVKISQKKKLDDPQVYPDNCYYFQNHHSISSSFSYLEKEIVEIAVNNTIHIAQQCILTLETSTLNMPTFTVPDGHSEGSYLAKLAYEKLSEIESDIADPAAYIERLEYELNVIEELGFSGYFLVIRDFIQYAKNNAIPVGPGRGSVCGSLVAFLAEVTSVDAVKYNLLFERFLSVHRRGSVPDVDSDFCATKRPLMFNYAVEKYGSEHCALVSTFGMRKAKASLRDTARVFDIDAELADEAAKLIPQVYYDEEGEKTTDLSIEDSLKIVPRLQEIADEYPEWFAMAIKLEDLPRNSSIHAAGTIISPISLVDHIPLIKPNMENINATALNLTDAEAANFIKFDFLSIATLTTIAATEHDVGYAFDFVSDKFDDEATWEMIGSKHTTCLFQISSKTYKDRMPRLKPKTILELAACLALVRGPCIASKADQTYMEIIEGKKEVELIHEFYDIATKDTKGILLYQEQIMNIAVNFGLSIEEGFKLMKAVAKKKIDTIKSYEDQFRELAAAQDVSEEAMDKIWKLIIDAGLYSFNASHAVAYALLCYQSAYLKVHYPLYYMKNALTNACLRKEDVEDVVEECRHLGIRFAPASVNTSSWEFSIDDIETNSIRIGLCAIKSFGEKAMEPILAERPFESIQDFTDRVPKGKCSKGNIIPGLFVGMFSDFEEDRRAAYETFCEIRKEEPVEEIKLQGGQCFRTDDAYDIIEELIFGAAMLSSPVNNFIPIGFEDLKLKSKFTIDAVVRKVKKHKDKNGRNMAFLTLETADGAIDCTLFSDVYNTQKSYCKKNLIVKCTAKKDSSNSCLAINFE